ncbi:hypothetical protein QUF94_27875 [Peribacillus sp. NJ4]|uniref:hypothetical protein n=1 Tax=Peribacillus sp. NJ4 TaxID=3055862 RepID=UPI0025A2D67F|nr:hypothetical protein [Peribacillus sp. NJ4]MDM5215131.1 hypothetical protein [Peribacillus sp. NJ4]
MKVNVPAQGNQGPQGPQGAHSRRSRRLEQPTAPTGPIGATGDPGSGGLIPFSTGIIISGATVVSAAPILMGIGNHTVKVIDVLDNQLVHQKQVVLLSQFPLREPFKIYK